MKIASSFESIALSNSVLSFATGDCFHQSFEMSSLNYLHEALIRGYRTSAIARGGGHEG